MLSSKNSDPEYVDICSVLEQPDVRTLSRVGFSSVYHLYVYKLDHQRGNGNV